MSASLTRRRPASAPPAVRKEPTLVSTPHIPYVATLWARLQAARKQVAAKEAYVRDAGSVGIKVAALDRVADDARADAETIRRAASELERIKQLLALDAEPTTTPAHWFCGVLTMAEGAATGKDHWGDDTFPPESWPQARSGRDTIAVFQGAMPVEALRRYAATKHLLDDARVYSPRADDFYWQPEPQLRDPVLIGRIGFLGEWQYFELARWDIDEDLAVVFGSVGGKVAR